jgi:hypothetical protein
MGTTRFWETYATGQIKTRYFNDKVAFLMRYATI